MHLLIHLEYELDNCGLIRTIWLYPIEWYIKVLKKLVHNKGKLEGIMSKPGYSMKEDIGFT